MPKIDAGIGVITWDTDSLLLEQVMEAVEAKLMGTTPVEFITELNSPGLFDSLRKMTDKVAELQAKNQELAEDLDRANDRKLGTEIDTGIGTIRYEIEGSLDQEFLMEALADLIKEQGVKGVLDHLRAEFRV